jgi:hypothetical protein
LPRIAATGKSNLRKGENIKWKSEASSIHLSRWAATLATIDVAAALGCNSSTVTPATLPAAGSATSETGPTAAPATPVAKSVPSVLAQMGEYGENNYDAAKAGKWKEEEWARFAQEYSAILRP